MKLRIEDGGATKLVSGKMHLPNLNYQRTWSILIFSFTFHFLARKNLNLYKMLPIIFRLKKLRVCIRAIKFTKGEGMYVVRFPHPRHSLMLKLKGTY